MNRTEIEKALAEINGVTDRDRAYVAGLLVGAMVFSGHSQKEATDKVIKKIRDDMSDGISGDKAPLIQAALEKASGE